MKDIQSFGTISEEQLDYLLEPEYGSNMGGIGLDWNGYELLLWCASDSKEKVPVRDGMVEEIRLDSEKNKDLTMNGFNFSMTPEEIIEKCGKPTQTDNEENGYLCYRYKGTKSEFLFGFENGVMHEMAFSVSID